MSVDEKMTAIADAIRGYTSKSDKLNLDGMATGISEVYGNGRTEGYSEGHSEGLSEGREQGYSFGFEEGKQVEYDAFWDVLQKYGNEANYNYAFAYGKFTDANYKPKYPILTLAGTTPASGTFYEAKDITDIKVPFICKARAYETFYSCSNLVKIPEFNVTQDTLFRNTFSQDRALEEINMTGTIGQNGFDIHWSENLNKKSIESIINALSSNTEGLEITLPKTAVNNAFGINVDDASTYPEGSEYYVLRQSKSNWTIKYS